MTLLNNVVTLVTGASRGAGRGIALELGASGATVYVTGRSVGGRPTTDNVPGTIDETARGVTDRGGHGIAVRCDHTSDADVELLFARIHGDHGRLDILVNNVWGGYEHSECRPLPGCWCRSGSNPSINGTACSPPASARISRRAAWPCR
jgi:NAD(P)-dependent dehydrogenase (short-subunit alcohol dehydrogenase family)